MDPNTARATAQGTHQHFLMYAFFLVSIRSKLLQVRCIYHGDCNWYLLANVDSMLIAAVYLLK